MDRNLNQEKLRQFYDHFGAKQDAQGFYEDAALDALVQLGGFEGAQSVFEIGCGTGKFADRLLTRYLPPTAKYVGIRSERDDGSAYAHTPSPLGAAC